MQMGQTGDRTADRQVGGRPLYPSATAAQTVFEKHPVVCVSVCDIAPPLESVRAPHFENHCVMCACEWKDEEEERLGLLPAARIPKWPPCRRHRCVAIQL
ncbi:unnamed protein product [Pleuronectes platessa]|uniref:Uncharacterized protein n=1 Tax=Pleuronectes platessa TaxID=8262 RepID=A0A9N7UG78_PLEPL|nr:unnamed protein product [Pleuronectes platessa]